MIGKRLDLNSSVKRGIYILPSVVTSGNLACGFLSVIYSIHNNYTPAAWLVLAAIGFDVMDGRIARWTKSNSSFGIELDSLSDLISFGVAPAILMYQMLLHTMNKPGIAIALFFVIACALRLAKFNVKAHDGETCSHFSGLPTPAAAGMLASFVLSYELFQQGGEITVKTIPMLMQRMPFFFNMIPAIMVISSILMISTVPYMAFKKMKLNRPKPLQMLLFILISIMLILAYPQNTIFIMFTLYLLSGIALQLLRYRRLKRTQNSNVVTTDAADTLEIEKETK
jgi:CDP-diacylglycerol--serine O-phosphatidyltransferase